jgi:hypothetical protein
MRRPSPAVVIATAALFVAMSGTAYAATGGTFLLGKANTATSVTSLSNSKGTALSLSSNTNKPPLTVNSAVQVPNLNASTVDGYSAYSFVQGGGTEHVVWGGPTSITATSEQTTALIWAPPNDLIELEGDCDANNAGVAQLVLYNYTGQTIEYAYTDTSDSTTSGVGGTLGSGHSAPVSSNVVDPDIATIQVTAGSQILTFIANIQDSVYAGAMYCTFSAQLTTNE